MCPTLKLFLVYLVLNKLHLMNNLINHSFTIFLLFYIHKKKELSYNRKYVNTLPYLNDYIRIV